MKYGPIPPQTPVERLSHFTHVDDQNGSRGIQDHSSAADDQPWAEGESEWMDAKDPLAIPIASPTDESTPEASKVKVGEPSLTQIPDTIKSCLASLSMQIETLRVDFAILKEDVHKVRNRVSNAEQCISAVEDDLNPLMVTGREVVVDHKSQ